MEQGYHLSQRQVGTRRVMEQVIAPVSATGGNSQGHGAGKGPISATGGRTTWWVLILIINVTNASAIII